MNNVDFEFLDSIVDGAISHTGKILSDAVAKILSEFWHNEIILPKIKDWQAGQIKTIEDLRSEIGVAIIAKPLNDTSIAKINDVFVNWLLALLEEIKGKTSLHFPKHKIQMSSLREQIFENAVLLFPDNILKDSFTTDSILFNLLGIAIASFLFPIDDFLIAPAALLILLATPIPAFREFLLKKVFVTGLYTDQMKGKMEKSLRSNLEKNLLTLLSPVAKVIKEELRENIASSPQTRKKIKILFLAANPIDTDRLRLDEEIKQIDKAIRQSEYRDFFELEQQWALTVDDIQSHILRFKPNILHFSGHGSNKSEIVLENSDGVSYYVGKAAFVKLFTIFKEEIKCVVLNACYSKNQAMALAEQINCVIGMTKAIGDNAAISFSKSFYQALGYGRDIQTAFELGCNQIDLKNLGDEDVPQLIALSCNPKEINFLRL